MQELWYWRHRETEENTIGRTQEGSRQHEQCEIHKEREKRLMSHFNKSAITDHATTENQIIIWEGAKIIDKEPNKRTQQVKEAIWIRKTKTPMNRDEGNYELPHVYDDVFRPKYRRSRRVTSTESLYK